MNTIYTIGHSNRELAEFLELLESNGIQIVVDVRKMPRSRANPQFNGSELAKELASVGIQYRHLESLTGFRGKGTKESNAWENKSFQNYANYMRTEEFQAGIKQLEEMAKKGVPAIMCSEAVWWRCHRRMIADALVAQRHKVLHITSKSKPSPHELTKFARVDHEQVTYPLPTSSQEKSSEL